jgi:hypothetical protein
MPGHTVSSSLDDLINGFDRQMAYVFNLIASGASKAIDTHEVRFAALTTGMME